MTAYRLFGAETSPYSVKVRSFLKYKGVEFEWIGRDLKIGEARLHVSKRITRCLATTVNTDTGARDVDTLAALDRLGHRDFGVTLTVTTGGEIAVGDELELI